jgi:predicted ATPase
MRGIMQNLDFQPELIGREAELTELKRYLDKASGGTGCTMFISGEAGIGKTRLLDELKKIAESMDFQIISGNCMYESLTPFMPFVEALRARGLDYLFEKEAPKVESVYLITHSGLMVEEAARKDTRLDSDLFTAMLSTIGNFVKDSLSMMLGSDTGGTLNTLGYQNYRILIEQGASTNLAVIISGKENEFLVNDMREILNKIQKGYGDLLANWDGDDELIGGLKEILEPLIHSGKYDGFYYGEDESDLRRNILFENITLGLARFSETQPTFLSIDDMQWADHSTLALFHYIARNTRSNRLFIIGTYRPEDVSSSDGAKHPLLKTKQQMEHEELTRELVLKRLDELSMPELLNSMFDGSEFSTEFTKRIHQETDGNPLFIIELMKLLVDENWIVQFGNVWHESKDLDSIEIPSRIYNVITRRLNRVDREARRILDCAAVIGESFTSTIVSDALDKKKIELLEHLRDLEVTHRLIHTNNGDFRFDNAKIKEVLYSEIPTELRSEYHNVIANSIAIRYRSELDRVVYDLARHYFYGGDYKQSLQYSILAGEKALSKFAVEKSLQFYEKAWQSLKQIEDDIKGKDDNWEKQLNIIMKLSDLSTHIGEWDNAIRYTRELHELSKSNGDEHNQAHACWKEGQIHSYRSSWSDAIDNYNKSLDIAQRSNYTAGLMRVYRGLGAVYEKMGKYEEAMDYYNKYMSSAEEHESPYDVASCFRAYASISSSWGKYETALEYYKKSIDILEDIESFSELAKAYTGLGVTYFELGEFDKAIEQNKKVIKLTSRIGDIRVKGYGYSNTAEAFAQRNDLDSALEYANFALEIFTKLGEKAMVGLVWMNFGIIHMKKGNWIESSQYFERSIDILREQKVPYYLADSTHQYGLMLAAHNTPESIKKARECLENSLKLYNDLGSEKYIKLIQTELKELFNK